MVTTVLWIDANLDNKENSAYIKELQSIGTLRLILFQTIKEAIEQLKYFKFLKTKIIINGSLFYDFIKSFKDNILDIKLTPHIMVFTKKEENFIKENENYKDDKNIFYVFSGIATSFEGVKEFLKNKKIEYIKKQKDTQLMFAYINKKHKFILPIRTFVVKNINNIFRIIIILQQLIFVNLYQEISLIVKGTGSQKIINTQSSRCSGNNNPKPSKIIINGKEQISDYSVYLQENINNITMIWSDYITNCNSMFYGLNNITHFDFSKFDTSRVTSMDCMFEDCSSITSLDLSNFNTSSVTRMHGMFCGCNSLKYLDISNFDTSKIKDMRYFFNRCKSLESINLSSFNTSLVNDMYRMFYYCKKLVLLDLSMFDTSNVIYTEDMFEGCDSLKYLNLFSFSTTTLTDILKFIPDNIILCYNKNKLSSSDLQNFLNKTNNCSYICLEKSLKFIIGKKICIDECSKDDIYKYEYNNKCYLLCTNKTLIDEGNICSNDNCDIYYDKNKIICIKNIPDRYFLNDSLSPTIDKCKINCKKCDLESNNLGMCISCNNEDNYYQYNYFNKSTQNINYIYCNKCPDDKKKLIKNKKECIDDCNKDNYYKYEYKKECIFECPNNTIIINNNYCDNICSRELPYEIIELQKCVKNCNNSPDNLCILKYKEFVMDDSQKEEMINEIKDNLLKGKLKDELKIIKNGSDYIKYESEIIISITTTENQMKNKKTNISAINLGKCEFELKKYYNISYNESLYILKIDIQKSDMKIPKLEYEIFFPLNDNNLTKLNLSICKNINIDISLPIFLEKNNLDKHNISSKYYNDICYIDNSGTGVDTILNDRNKEYIENDLYVCEENCNFSKYDTNYNKVICSCKTKSYMELISNININKTLFINNMKNFKNIINLNVMKCYHVLFTLGGIKNNIGSYILISVILFNLISIIIFATKDYKRIEEQIKDLLNEIKNKIKENSTVPNDNKNISKLVIKNDRRKNKLRKKERKNLIILLL